MTIYKNWTDRRIVIRTAEGPEIVVPKNGTEFGKLEEMHVDSEELIANRHVSNRWALPEPDPSKNVVHIVPVEAALLHAGRLDVVYADRPVRVQNVGVVCYTQLVRLL